MHLALIGCGVQAGDEVLVQSFTFCASSHPVTYPVQSLCLFVLKKIREYGPGVAGGSYQRPYGENGKEAQGDCSGGALRYAIRL